MVTGDADVVMKSNMLLCAEMLSNFNAMLWSRPPTMACLLGANLFCTYP